MKADAKDLLTALRSRSIDTAGTRFVEALAHGSMSVEFYAPVDVDDQQPHEQDELYYVHTGTGVFLLDGERHEFGPGTCFFVRAGVAHKFEQFTPDFSTWVVFWGPKGGEASA